MSKKKSTNSESQKTKKPTIEQYLFSIDTANRELDRNIESLNDKFLDMKEEIRDLRRSISELNATIYEDRHVLADFVQKFFKDTKTVLNPKLAITGDRKAKK